MMPQSERIARSSGSRTRSGRRTTASLRTVAVVSRNRDQHVVGAVLGAFGHDVVLVEPTDHAYSHINQTRPDLVIVCMSSDDIDACQVLSMLALDRETSAIPVLAHVTSIAADAAVTTRTFCCS